MKRMKKWLPFERSEAKPATPSGTSPVETSPLLAIRQEMDRLFERLVSAPLEGWARPELGLAPDGWFAGTHSGRFAPTVDIADEEAHLRITAELPGMDEKDIEVSVDDDVLVIRGEKKLERKEEKESYYRVERCEGSFERAVPLPVDVRSEGAEAKFRKGVLTVRLPKIETGRTSRIIPVH